MLISIYYKVIRIILFSENASDLLHLCLVSIRLDVHILRIQLDFQSVNT
jgi:hypothetical protein